MVARLAGEPVGDVDVAIKKRDLVREPVVRVCRKHVAYFLKRRPLLNNLASCYFRTIGKFQDAFFEFDNVSSELGVFGAERSNRLRLFGLIGGKSFDYRLLDVYAVFGNNLFRN